jgi:putative oxidoreductase
VDAQKHGFYEKIHIKNAYNLDPLTFEVFYDKWLLEIKLLRQADKDTPIIVYGGNISRPFDQEVARLLIKKGHNHVRVLGGGYHAWKEGFDFGSEKPKPEPELDEGGLQRFLTLVERATLAIFLVLLIPPVWRSPYLSLGCRLVLGIIFLAFSLGKIIHPAVFAQNTINYQMMPAWGINLFALALPGLELVAGLCLVLGIRARAAATVIGGMNLMFIVGLTYALLQGVPINCGCHGEVGEPITWWKIATNAGMLVMSLQIFLYDRLFVLDRGGLIWREREV